jgi:hypothetical protein
VFTSFDLPGILDGQFTRIAIKLNLQKHETAFMFRLNSLTQTHSLQKKSAFDKHFKGESPSSQFSPQISALISNVTGEISGSQSDEYEDGCLLR